jgi:glycogen debranching enzyme
VRGRVVAVERADGLLAPGIAVAWEYATGAGRVLCIGAHLWFSAADDLDAHRERMLANALATLTRRVPRAPVVWPDPFAELPPLGDGEVPPVQLRGALPEIASPITLGSVARGDAPFTLAGRRALAIGAERSGLHAIWMHPLRLLDGPIAMRIDEEIPDVRSIEVSPEQIVRYLQTRTRFVEERIFVPLHEPIVVVEYRYRRLGRSRADVEAPMLDLRLPLGLALAAPMPAEVLHPLRAARRRDAGVASCVVVGADDHYRALLAAEGRAELAVEGDASRVVATVSASLSQPLRLVFAATVGGRTGLARIVRSLSRDGLRELAVRRAEWAAMLQDAHIALRSPNALLDTALEWAKVRLVDAVATSPGVGTGLVGPYNAPDDALGPRFADPHWPALALLAAGCFDEVKSALALLGAAQDAAGWMPDECSTSGVARYRSHRATAGWLRVLAAYDDWSGDDATVRALWGHAERALEAVRLDLDRQAFAEGADLPDLATRALLLEEALPLAVALRDVARVADRLEALDWKERCVALAERAEARARALLAGAGPLDVAQSLALGLAPAGDAAAALDALDALERPAFSAPHGLRIVPRDDPAFDPEVHGDSARAVATGWLSLAEFGAHRQEPGYRHLVAVASLCYEGAKGAFDAGVDAESGGDAGFAPDDPVAAAMVVLPVVTGLLGAVPDAPRRRLRLTPHWPRGWTRASVGPIRVGAAELELDAVEGCLVADAPYDGVRYRLRVRPPGGLTVVLEHPVGGRSFTRVLINGAEVDFERCGTEGCPHVRVVVAPVAELEVQFVGNRFGRDADDESGDDTDETDDAGHE